MKRTLFYLPAAALLLLGGAALGYRAAQGKTIHATQPLYYVDPMHPAYHSNKPGVAPDCGMQLKPVFAEDLSRGDEPGGLADGRVHLSPGVQRKFGIQVTAVERSASRKIIRVTGRVAADETRVYRVNFGVDGLVKETHGDSVGSLVKRNQHLALVYSPEFLSVAGGYLSANEHSPSSSTRDNTAPTPNAASAQARADRLRILGMSDAQIEEVSATRKIPEDVYVVSPADGVVIERNISPGQRFERHTDLYRVADLSHVWILADTFGSDSRAFRPGTMAHITLPGTGESFRARVSDTLPTVDPGTHSVRVRMELDNPGLRLRPDEFVHVEVESALPAGLTIPVEALLDSGLSKHVFVEMADGAFAARDVQTGWSASDQVEIVRGLSAGERVVTQGSFLVDSESRLRRVDIAEAPHAH
jgi:Cu(I)/Ag(I) efflux system membrane fusion protein